MNSHMFQSFPFYHPDSLISFDIDSLENDSTLAAHPLSCH